MPESPSFWELQLVDKERLFMALITRRSGRVSIPLALILLALIAALAFSFVTKGLAHAAVEPLTKISSDPYTNTTSNHKTEVEPDTFAFGNTVVSAFQVGRFFDGGGSNIGWATSTDRGQTFTHGFMPGTTTLATPAGPFDRVSDASVAYDAKHKVWMASSLGLLNVNGGVLGASLFVNRSTNGGTTWQSPVTVHAATGTENLDKNWTVCDDTRTSPFYGHCYTEWDDNGNLNRVQMSTSTDGGLHWSAPVSTPDHAFVIGGQPLVQPNGTVIVPINDGFSATILSFRSTNGGKTWSKPVLAAQILNAGHPGNIRAGALPSAEIDRSGRVYVVWPDCRFEAACSAAAVNDLVLISSADGIHWTLPKRIPTAPVGSGADYLIPGLAVDRSTSGSSAHLGLTYYYFPNANCTPSTCRLNVGFISSTNGGASWSSAQQLAGPMDLTWLPLTSQGFMVGDYISTSIVPGAQEAVPVFAVATAPTGTSTSCSNLSTGAPGQNCHEAIFTTSAPLVLVGGTNVSHDVAPANLPKKGSSSTLQNAR
jgi:hypothetical protein